MKAVILAGGFGVRFRPLTFSKPKPMLPLLNRPLITHILDHVKSHGIDEVFVTTNYRREQIIDYLGFEYNGIKLTYPDEEQPLGTAGSVKNIQKLLGETFVVIQGDTISDIDLTSLVKDHRYYGSLLTIATTVVDEPWHYGVVNVGDNGLIKRFQEKPTAENCCTKQVNTGIYVVEPEALNFVPENTFFDFAKDLFPLLVERGSIYASTADGFWIDVGKPDGYNKAKEWLMGNNKLNKRIPDSSIIDGSMEGQVFFGENVIVKRGARLVGPVVVGDNALIEPDASIMPYSIVGPGVTVRGYTVIDGAVLFENSVIGPSSSVENSIIAEDCILGGYSQIQSDVLLGSSCMLERNVSVINGSRVWPNMYLPPNSLVSGTLKSFIPRDEVYNDPLWSLRTVTSEEAFYFNKNENNSILFTGFRARSLLEFAEIVKQVEAGSVEYHMRGDVNDFRRWVRQVFGDVKLADEFEVVKKEFVGLGLNRDALKGKIADIANTRLDELVTLVNKSKLYK